MIFSFILLLLLIVFLCYYSRIFSYLNVRELFGYVSESINTVSYTYYVNARYFLVRRYPFFSYYFRDSYKIQNKLRILKFLFMCYICYNLYTTQSIISESIILFSILCLLVFANFVIVLLLNYFQISFFIRFVLMMLFNCFGYYLFFDYLLLYYHIISKMNLKIFSLYINDPSTFDSSYWVSLLMNKYSFVLPENVFSLIVADSNCILDCYSFFYSYYFYSTHKCYFTYIFINNFFLCKTLIYILLSIVFNIFLICIINYVIQCIRNFYVIYLKYTMIYPCYYCFLRQFYWYFDHYTMNVIFFVEILLFIISYFIISIFA